MKALKFKKKIALLICSIAALAASVSSSMCIIWVFNEPKMPKSLYKRN